MSCLNVAERPPTEQDPSTGELDSMQPTLTTSLHRLPRTLDRASRAAALAVVLALGASACGDAGLDLGDDSERVSRDEEVGRAGDGDEEDAGAPEEVVPPEPSPEPKGSPGDSSDPEEDPIATPQAPMAPNGEPDAPTFFPQPTAVMPTPVGVPTPVMSMFPQPVAVPSSGPNPEPMCAEGRVSCNGQCVDVLEDLENCGACGLVCDLGLSCSMGVCAAKCGNSLLEGMEACDDGNTTANDGCDAACQVEAAFACPSAGEPCLVAECGDGVVQNEECDDGNAVEGDGCFLCEVEAGWVCDAEVESDAGTAGSSCASVCGDNVLTGAEQCDLGEQNGEGDCSLDCRSTFCGNMVCDSDEDESSCPADCASAND
jgi:cysteine-rich repeat protein